MRGKITAAIFESKGGEMRDEIAMLMIFLGVVTAIIFAVFQVITVLHEPLTRLVSYLGENPATMIPVGLLLVLLGFLLLKREAKAVKG